LLADLAGERETLFVMGVLVLGVSVATALMHGVLNRREPAHEARVVVTLVGGE
jgi:formate-dependent nitrite reductase membrane component NrfD